MKNIHVKKNIALILATAFISSTAAADQYEDYARVKSATPEYERVNSPRQECASEYIQGNSHKGERSYGGSILGGITGAIVGNQVGNGRGRDVATMVGAITGTIVGDRMQNSGHDDNEGHEGRRCRSVDRWESRLNGYRVIYNYAGHDYSTVLPNNPGRELRVRVSVEPE